MTFTKQIPIATAVGYIVVQFIAGILASAFFLLFRSDQNDDLKVTELTTVAFIGMNTIAALLVSFVFLLINKNNISGVVGGAAIGGSYFVAIAGTSAFMQVGINPAV